MKAAVFLLTLCLFLMGGADRVFAGTHSKSCCYARTYHHEMMPEMNKKTGGPDAAVGLAAISTDDDFFIIQGLDEEDIDETLARKFRQAGKFYELLFLQSIPQPDHLFKPAPSLFHQDSDKYISQRVFRV